MANLASVLLFYGAGVAVALGTAWLFVKLTELSRRRLEPPVGTHLRIRAESGMYRAHVVRLGSVWTISAPLQRDHYVPLRVGEELVVEAATKHGALLFRSQVLARQNDPHLIILQRPEKLHRVERRDHKRWPQAQGVRIKVEGETAYLLDLSQGGARVKTSVRTHKGDRLRLDLPWGQEVYGWVLANEGNEARVRFEELIEAGSFRKTETAPAI